MVQSSRAFPYGLTFGSSAGTPTTSIDIVLVYDTKLLSVAVTLTEYLPALVLTVPEMPPAEFIDRPFGRPFVLKV